MTSAQLAGGAFNEQYPKADSVIVLMAVALLERVVDHLLSDGWSPDTPALIIERGTQAGEQEVIGRLREISALARDHNIESPALLAVGTVASRKLGFPSSSAPRHLAANGASFRDGTASPRDLEASPVARPRGRI